ncbi:MAG: hypothetical protein GC191_18425 [Azospirillum sp.]|nr:hypothetical protein [Azospirillum sp.]
MADDLVITWAVYRSLDDVTGAPSSANAVRMAASERVERWRQADPTDDDLLSMIREVYRCNLSRRQVGEPRIVVSGQSVVKFYKALDADVIGKLVATCASSLKGSRDRAAILLAWDVIWSAKRRDLKTICVLPAEKVDQLSLSEATRTAVAAWLDAAAVRVGPVLREITADGCVLDEALSADSLREIEANRAVLARLARWNPMLWVDWDDVEPDVNREKFPDAAGQKLAAIVRHLMTSTVPPPFPIRLL